MADIVTKRHCPIDTRRLVLASSSPRRQDLLRSLGLRFEVDPADVDELIPEGAEIEAAVTSLAGQKALDVAARHPRSLIVAADTLVSLDGRILGKPRDAAEGREMLQAMSGCRHRVYTGLAVLDTSTDAVWQDVVETDVYFRTLTEAEIDMYVATGEPMDKAGAYGAQSLGATLIERIDGDYFNVIGLPLAALNDLLRETGACILCRRLQDSGRD